MEFLNYIEAALKKTGSKAALARELGIDAPTLQNAIKGKRPFTPDALRRLSVLIDDGTKPGDIWEAQQAARAATEEERQLWLPFLMSKSRHVTHISAVMLAALCGLIAVNLVLTDDVKAAVKTTSYEASTLVNKHYRHIGHGVKRVSGRT